MNITNILVFTSNNILPKIGLRGVEKMADMAAWRKSIAECGTENGWANAWKADPQVI